IGSGIEQAIAKMRPEYQTCILLRYVDGRPYEEIAQIMELPLGTIKTYIHRARAELKGYLSKDEE
ncbi:MAG: RNA polymerase sigma factor, partial [Chloroflexi bacterium]|nr:RNA polymerase sigma factor [Chloroflexota bacterium]